MGRTTQATNETPKEQTARVCDQIRDELGLEENKGSYTLTQTEKRRILDELQDD